MALRFHVDIVSSEANIFSGSAERLVVPGEMGELGILARHAPLLRELALAIKLIRDLEKARMKKRG